jgi:predicted GNAT family acetyltransferase
MTEIIDISDRPLIEAFVRQDAALHIYELGDLDPFVWPHTRWFGLPDERGRLRALALLYTGGGLPVLIALGRADGGAIAQLVEAVVPRLPERLYSHLSPGLLTHMGERWSPIHHGRYLKMELQDHSKLIDVDVDEVERLAVGDLNAINELYGESYPGNWFDPRMLETGEYFGIRREGSWVCVAGVHVYSREYGVAALGNITTAPSWRGRGLARQAVAGLCRSLLEHVEIIGLNVKADNRPAIACYERLGFVEIAQYDEIMLEPARAYPGDG